MRLCLIELWHVLVVVCLPTGAAGLGRVTRACHHAAVA